MEKVKERLDASRSRADVLVMLVECLAGVSRPAEDCCVNPERRCLKVLRGLGFSFTFTSGIWSLSAGKVCMPPPV